MRLLEIVRGSRTGLDVLVSALAFAKRVKKLGVVVGNGPGFVGNRLMFPYMYETQFLVEEGATPAQVDRVLTDFGIAKAISAAREGTINLNRFRDAGGVSRPENSRLPQSQQQWADAPNRDKRTHTAQR
jgi:3-hydroxyacyl-CoA dehydrogenase